MALGKTVTIDVQANTGAAQREIDAMADKMEGLHKSAGLSAKSMLTMASELGNVVTGARNAIQMISALGVALEAQTKDMMKEAIQMRALKGSMDDLRQATRGLIDDDTLLGMAVRAQQTGVAANTKAFAQLAKDGYKVAAAAGFDMEQGLQAINDSLATGRVTTLRQMGVVIDLDTALESYARTQLTTVDQLTDEMRLRAQQEEILRVISAKARELDDVQEVAAENAARRAVEWRNWMDEMKDSFANFAGDVIEWDRKMDEALGMNRLDPKTYLEAKKARTGLTSSNLASTVAPQEQYPAEGPIFDPKAMEAAQKAQEAREKAAAAKAQAAADRHAAELEREEAKRAAEEARYQSEVAAFEKQQELLAAELEMREVVYLKELEIQQALQDEGLTPEQKAQREIAAQQAIYEAKVEYARLSSEGIEEELALQELRQERSESLTRARERQLQKQGQLEQKKLNQNKAMTDQAFAIAEQGTTAIAGVLFEMADGSGKSFARLVADAAKASAQQLTIQSIQYGVQAAAAAAALNFPQAAAYGIAAGIAGAGAATAFATFGIAKGADGGSGGGVPEGPGQRGRRASDNAPTSGGRAYSGTAATSGSSPSGLYNGGTAAQANSAAPVVVTANIWAPDRETLGNELDKLVTSSKRTLGG